MRATLVALAVLFIGVGCARKPRDPINLVDFTTQHPISVVFDRLDQLSRRCVAPAGLEVEGDVFNDTGSGAIDLKAPDGTVVLAINLKALSPGQTAVKLTYPPTTSIDRAWFPSVQALVDRGGTDCPAPAVKWSAQNDTAAARSSVQ